jgi:hypothetical protein
LHDTVEVLEEACIVTDGRIKIDVLCVGELCFRGIGRLRERIELDLFRVGYGFCDIGLAVALKIGPDEGITAVGVREERDIAIRDCAVIGRGLPGARGPA